MPISTPTLKKQILGGVLGMLVAVGLYTLVQQVDLSSVGAMIVSPGSLFSANSTSVRVNDGADPATIARLTQRAQRLASQLASSPAAAMSSSASVSSMEQVPTSLIGIKERLAARIAKAKAQQQSAVPTSAATLHSGADLQPVPPSTRLSGSGLGTSALVLISAGVAGIVMLRRRTFAFGGA